MESVYSDIESLIKSNMVFRFGLELSKTSDSDRKQTINNILTRLENKNTEISVKEKREKMFEDIDKKVYRQKWLKLQNFHKENKINEYIEEKYKDHQNKNQLRDLLLEYLNENKFKTEKYIKYDSIATKIIDIVGLVEEEGIFKFIDKKKTKKTESDKKSKKIVVKPKKK